MKLFVEGGGDSHTLRTSCREGFSRFLRKAGLAALPRIVACGSRQNAFKSFCAALRDGESAMLLVDSEAPVTAKSPWAHLRERPGDKWERPVRAKEGSCHLMVQCMEAWFLADPRMLRAFYGKGIHVEDLPPGGVESVAKDKLFQALAAAAKGAYSKRAHSFKLLARVDPEKVFEASPHARRFKEALAKLLA